MLTVFPGVSKFRLSVQVCSIKETTVGYNIPGASKFGVGEGMSMILELTWNCDWNKECRCGKHQKIFSYCVLQAPKLQTLCVLSVFQVDKSLAIETRPNAPSMLDPICRPLLQELTESTKI